MSCIRIPNGVVCIAGTYKAGDPPPSGYCDRHEWARVQMCAGLRQSKCPTCCKWCFPQERMGMMGCIKCVPTQTG